MIELAIEAGYLSKEATKILMVNLSSFVCEKLPSCLGPLLIFVQAWSYQVLRNKIINIIQELPNL